MSAPEAVISDLRAAIGIEIADETLLDALTRGISRVEESLRVNARSDVRAVNDAASHLVEAGGKRFRPLFTLLSAQFGDGRDDGVVTAATAVELVHLATLYHDDVMDEATMRRGAESVNARWDNTVAILTGDYLFAHASRLVSDLGTDAARIIAETFSELVSGQMRETAGPVDAEDPVEHYLTVIDQKTGSLIATAGRFGGMLTGASPEHIAALERYGKIIGAAFQISDDVIDIASNSAESGKVQGTDLREGVLTLPALYALGSDDVSPRLRQLLRQPLTDDALVAEALRLLRDSGGVERARDTLADYAARAREELAVLPASAARDACESIADYLVDRTR